MMHPKFRFSAEECLNHPYFENLMLNDKKENISPTYFMNKDFYHPDHDPRVYFREKFKEKQKEFRIVHSKELFLNSKIGNLSGAQHYNVVKHFIKEETKTPEKPFKHYFPKYHNKYSFLDVPYVKPKDERSEKIIRTTHDLPKQFSDHHILRMLKVGKNAIFGTEVADLNEIKKELDGRDFPYFSEKEMPSKNKFDLDPKTQRFRPIPHNVRSQPNLCNFKNAKNTYISEGVRNMGVGPTNFASGVLRDEDKYLKNGYGNRRMY
jgi:hypothetical protein